MNDHCCFEIDPHHIDCSGEWLFWKENPSESFLNSLRQWGQLEPVLVSKEREKSYLIAGYKRVQAAKKLGRPVWARQIEAGESQKGFIYLHSNWAGDLSKEKMVVCGRFFQSRVNSDRLPSFLWQNLNYFLSKRDFRLFLSWLDLPCSWDKHLLSGRIDLEMGPLLGKFSANELQELEPFFSSLKWSSNRARNFLNWILEICRRDGLTADKLLRENNFPQLLKANLAPKDLLERILDRTRSLRFPHLVYLKHSFDRLQKQLTVPGNLTIRPEENFETNSLYLAIRISSEPEAREAVRQMEELEASGVWKEIFQWQKEFLE